MATKKMAMKLGAVASLYVKAKDLSLEELRELGEWRDEAVRVLRAADGCVAVAVDLHI